MSNEFDVATSVVEESQNHFAARLHEGWGVWDTVNGGYVAAVAARAMIAASSMEHPVSVSAHFIRPAEVGPVGIETSPIWTGRAMSRVAATVIQGDRPIVTLLGTFGSVRHIPTRDLIPALPELPPLEDCIEPDRSGFENATVAQRIETYVPAVDAGFLEGNPSGTAQISAHIRFRDQRPIDPLALIFLADALPPPAFNLPNTPEWLPTVTLNVHIRQQPNPGWLRMQATSPHQNYDRVTEDVVIHDNSGRLVATASQLALASGR